MLSQLNDYVFHLFGGSTTPGSNAPIFQKAKEQSKPVSLLEKLLAISKNALFGAPVLSITVTPTPIEHYKAKVKSATSLTRSKGHSQGLNLGSSSEAGVLNLLTGIKEEYKRRYQSLSTTASNFEFLLDVLQWTKKNSSNLTKVSPLSTTVIGKIALVAIFIPPIVKVIVLWSNRDLNLNLRIRSNELQKRYERLLANRLAAAGEVPAVRTEEELNIRATFNALEQKQAFDWIEIRSQFYQICIKTVPVFIFTCLITMDSTKTVASLAKVIRKPTLGIFKDIYEIYKTSSSLIKQDELVHSLAEGAYDNVDSQEFLTRINLCPDMQSVKGEFRAAGIQDEFLPEQFPQFKFLMESRRYQSEIKRRYQYSRQTKSLFAHFSQFRISNKPLQRPYVNTEYTRQLIEQRQQEFNRKVDLMTNKINAISLTQSFESVKENFKLLSIDLDQLEVPLTTLEDVQTAINNPEQIRTLAKIGLSAIEAKAHHLQLVVRSSLLKKHTGERDHLYFTIVEASLSIASRAIQLLLKSSDSKEPNSYISNSISWLFKNLINTKAHPYFGIVFLLFPNLSIKIFSTLILGSLRFFFSKQYKPNEYSYQGYKLEFQIHLSALKQTLHHAKLMLQRALLWLNIELIEHRIMRMDILENDPRWNAIDAIQTDSDKNYQDAREQLENGLAALKEKDFDRMLFPNSQREENGAPLTGLGFITSTLKTEDLQFYPQEELDFLNFHLGLGISESGMLDGFSMTQEQISSKIRELFLAEGNDFVSFQADNQLSTPFLS